MMHDEKPTRSPSHPSMGGTFDRLVESNLELIRVIRISLFVRAAVTAIAIVLALHTVKTFTDEQREIRGIMTAILRDCKR